MRSQREKLWNIINCRGEMSDVGTERNVEGGKLTSRRVDVIDGRRREDADAWTHMSKGSKLWEERKSRRLGR